MQRTLTITTIFIAAQATTTLATAQNVFKCAGGYQQVPCAQGQAVPVDDARSAAQRAQSEAATRRDARLADDMEKTRLKAEARPASVGLPAAQEAPAKATARSAEPFTARAPGDPKTARNKGKKKQGAGKSPAGGKAA